MKMLASAAPGLALLVGIGLLGGCQSRDPAPVSSPAPVQTVRPQAEWRNIVQAADFDRLQRLGVAWEQAIGSIRGTANLRRLRAEGPLLNPTAALPRASLPPGNYRCRHIRFSPAARGRASFTTSGPFFCFVGVEGRGTSLTKQTGPERPGGYVYEDENELRQIFIGAAARGREQVPPAYGDKPERDLVGVVERVDSFRYRIVVPWPRSGGTLDVYELIPAAG